MAFENNQVRESFTAAVNLSAARYHLVRLSSAENISLVGSQGGTTGIGVLQTAPQSQEAATVALTGMSKVVAGSSMAVGDQFTASASGRAVTVTSGGYVYGRVLEAPTADGDICTVWLCMPYKFAG